MDGTGSSQGKPAGLPWVMGRGRPRANPTFGDGAVWDAAGRLSGVRLVSQLVGHPGRLAAAPGLCSGGQLRTRTPGALGRLWVAGGMGVYMEIPSFSLAAGREPVSSKPQAWESHFPK